MIFISAVRKISRYSIVILEEVVSVIIFFGFFLMPIINVTAPVFVTVMLTEELYLEGQQLPMLLP